LAQTDSSQTQTQKRGLIEDLARAREEAKLARTELDDVKLQTFREVDGLRAEMSALQGERDARVEECHDAKEALFEIKERVKELEAELQKLRLLFTEREVVHEEHLVNLEKQRALERKESAEAAARQVELAKQEAAVLRDSMTHVTTLLGDFELLKHDIDRLKADNECYAAEITEYQQAISCLYELRSTCDVARTAGLSLEGSVQAELEEQLEHETTKEQRCERRRALRIDSDAPPHCQYSQACFGAQQLATPGRGFRRRGGVTTVRWWRGRWGHFLSQE